MKKFKFALMALAITSTGAIAKDWPCTKVVPNWVTAPIDSCRMAGSGPNPIERVYHVEEVVPPPPPPHECPPKDPPSEGNEDPA